MRLGEKLAKLRNENGLTQKELSDLFLISRSTYAQYETNNRQPDYEMLTKLADYFKVTTDYLLGRENITIAANRTDDPMSNLPPEAIEEIEKFKEFVRHKYKK